MKQHHFNLVRSLIWSIMIVFLPFFLLVEGKSVIGANELVKEAQIKVPIMQSNLGQETQNYANIPVLIEDDPMEAMETFWPFTNNRYRYRRPYNRISYPPRRPVIVRERGWWVAP